MNWRSLGDATTTDFRAALAGTPLDPVALDLYRISTPNTILLLAQLQHESNYGLQGVAASGGHNPLGLRPRGGGSGFQWFPDWQSAVREWSLRISDPTYRYASTTTIEEFVHVYAPNGDGANDEAAYVRAIQDAFVRYGPTSQATGGVSTMASYPVAGLAAKIDLPVPLIQAIVPVGQTNQRPGIKRQLPGYWVQHETANTNAGADAAMHARYLLQGGDGSQVSWHFTVDDHQIYQHIPVDEITWQAADGAGPGNMSGVSCEMAVNSDGNEAKARSNAEALAGAICKALGLGVDRVKRHWDFNGALPASQRHHCPDHMMNDNYWPTFTANVGKIIAGGSAVPAQPDFPEGMDAGIASILFGKVDKYEFNPIGPLSLAWLADGAKTGEYPQLVKVQVSKDSATISRTYFIFSNGAVYWRPNDNAAIRQL